MEAFQLEPECGGGFFLLGVDFLHALAEFPEAFTERVQKRSEVLVVLLEEPGAFFFQEAPGKIFELQFHPLLHFGNPARVVIETCGEVRIFGLDGGE